MMRAALVAVSLLALLTAGCGGRAADEITVERTVEVYVDAGGRVTADGEEVSLGELRQRFAKLKEEGGAVRYSRANPEIDPPPMAMEVIQAIVDAELQVELVE